jgi:methyl-accepting chemotaxis protein
MNENSNSSSILQSMNVINKVLGVQLLSFLIICIVCFVFFRQSRQWWIASLEKPAKKQFETYKKHVLPLLKTTNKQEARIEQFEKLKMQTIIIKDRNVLLSSYAGEDGNWRSGGTFQKSLSENNEAFSHKDDIVWFIWDGSKKVHIGVIFSARGFDDTRLFLGFLIFSLLVLGTSISLWLIHKILAAEIREPLSNISRNLIYMSEGQLENRADDLASLELRWESQSSHELYGIVVALRTVHRALMRTTEQARAIANDNLENPLFDGANSGELLGSLGDIVKFQRGLANGLSLLSTGDFTSEPIVELKPEGTLGRTFFQMRDGVQLLLERLTLASEHLRISANDLQESSSAQASAATKQADGVTETMATMEELAASSGHIADTAKHVVMIAEQTLENAREGQDAVENVGQGMEDIVKASLRGAERLFKLDEKSRSISRVATLIANVAEQSKILALNAAIEAAHAGEAGRGFSVVAEEVRNLANSVFESTRDIENLINEIQNEIQQAVQASEEEVKRANKGRDLAQDAQGTIVSIFSSAEKMTQAAHQIELATNQQRSASGQVATAVREMATSAEEVAKGATTVRHSLVDLGNLAQDLGEIVGHFEEEASSNGKGLDGNGQQ